MVKIMDIRSSKRALWFLGSLPGVCGRKQDKPDRLPFYVNWAKNFTNFLPGKPLKDRSGKDIEAFLADLGDRRNNGAETVGTCQRCHHHDLHPRTEQAQALSKESGGYLTKAKINDLVRALRGNQPRLPLDDRTLSKKDRGVKIFR